MRLVLALCALVTGLTILPGLAAANCDIGGRSVPCETRNGHYRIRLPEGPGPFPAVVYLYGSLGNSAQILSNDGFVQAFVERGYAVIVPAGLNIRYKTAYGSGWFLRNSRGHKKRNDTNFVAEVIAAAEIRHRIDRRRLLIAGMSNGGFLAWEIACHAPNLATAYAPVAAGYLGKMPKRCKQPVRILHTHGRADRIVTIDNSGDRRSGGARIMLLSETMERIGRSNGCVEPGRPRKFREYDRTSWRGCPPGGSVDLLLHDGGHTIPLSWYSTVIDWFEGEGGSATPVGGGTARFESVGGESRRLGRTDGGKTSRFKRP